MFWGLDHPCLERLSVALGVAESLYPPPRPRHWSPSDQQLVTSGCGRDSLTKWATNWIHFVISFARVINNRRCFENDRRQCTVLLAARAQVTLSTALLRLQIVSGARQQWASTVPCRPFKFKHASTTITPRVHMQLIMSISCAVTNCQLWKTGWNCRHNPEFRRRRSFLISPTSS